MASLRLDERSEIDDKVISPTAMTVSSTISESVMTRAKPDSDDARRVFGVFMGFVLG
jgi:hypothetical protein